MVDRLEIAYAKFNNICVVVAFLSALIVYCTDPGEKEGEGEDPLVLGSVRIYQSTAITSRVSQLAC